MQPLPLEFLVPVGALESVAGLLPLVIFVLVLVNFGLRVLAQRSYESAAEEGDDDEALSRYLPLEAVNVLLVLLSFAYLVVHPHAGMVLSVLVLGMVLSDFFEYEARRVEARNGMELERPNSSIVMSVLVFLYAAFESVFFLIQPYWTQII
ncbi:DUF7313 family protein [Candidatus Halobonum tyrrellensis]|uniref:DUF7313 domain-containing protein n=1 Tax=Candidatus Halobonum tyrrellensis G22 TaxID=1324957 RepID=V4HF79_9EURY|nr:hypothetical protein [Candidatus Halobonum tyrrellensis]ESP89325.1 hypothetical protein K933_04886 [Candidatus Halobonum tyrrellensis G22]